MAFKKNIIVEEANDLSKYGKEFQAKLLRLIVKDRAFAFSITPIIKDTYFSDPYLKTIFSCANDYIVKYKSCPNFDNIKIMLQDRGEKLTVYEKMLDSIENVSLDDRQFVIDNTRNFCFTKFALAEQLKVNEALKRGEFELAKKISNESFRFSGGYTAKIYDLKDDYKVIFHSDEFRVPIELPFPTYNDNTKGGIGTGDLMVIVAPSNFGKSAALTAVSRHANVIGKNVVYFSFEMGHESVFSRYIAGLLDIRQEHLPQHEEEIDAMFQERNLGRFKLVQERATNATVNSIVSMVDYLKSTGFFPDLICVDALNQLKAPEGKWYKDDNARFEAICEELRDLAQELNIPIVTACQTNRSGFDADVNGVQSIGKALEIFQVADVVISFSQKPEMEDMQEAIASLIKNRHGKKNLTLLVHYDPNKGVFVEKEVLNPTLLLSNKDQQRVKATISNLREKFIPKK